MTANKSRGVAEQYRLRFWSTEAGAKHVPGLRYDLGTFDKADAKTEASHHLKVDEMMWTVGGA